MMGYFSNGTEGDIYEQEYCSKCVHDQCSVMLLHLAWNYDDVNDRKKPKPRALDLFIPIEGIENKKCTMFFEERDQ